MNTVSTKIAKFAEENLPGDVRIAKEQVLGVALSLGFILKEGDEAAAISWSGRKRILVGEDRFFDLESSHTVYYHGKDFPEVYMDSGGVVYLPYLGFSHSGTLPRECVKGGKGATLENLLEALGFTPVWAPFEEPVVAIRLPDALLEEKGLQVFYYCLESEMRGKETEG